MVPLIPEPEDILVIFAGGEESNMASVIPSWGPRLVPPPLPGQSVPSD